MTHAYQNLERGKMEMNVKKEAGDHLFTTIFYRLEKEWNKQQINLTKLINYQWAGKKKLMRQTSK